MSILNLLDIEGGIRAFFSSLSVSISFDLMFIIGLSLELVLILFFIIKSYCSYEIRTTKALDRLNKWLFINKKLTTENIKEFTNLVKSGPKRLSYNWQQYILYREKAPSQYLTVENIIEKPLKASSFDSNIKNLGIFSFIISVLMFIVGLAHSGSGSSDTVLNTYLLIVALAIPCIMLLMYSVAKMCLVAKKHSNLDSLYQNLHLFHRFVDNACVDLPQFIDFTLLFSVEEIEKGIPALREFLENRARKEKEEFDKARNEMVEYEKYDFEKAGVDGSNILDRAMRESEVYLSNKDKTLAKISQIEAALESLKKNFDNVQKDFQRKMQVSKENIDRLRQSQEETTSRIESNFLRKQQMAEIAKQEKEESDFEQQKRRYLVEKNDYEQEIKNLQSELDSGKDKAEKAMLSEYQSFYTRICKSAAETVDNEVKSELSTLKKNSETTEEDLAEAQTLIKRLEDENLTLRRKLGLDENSSILTANTTEEEVVNQINIQKEAEQKTEPTNYFDEPSEPAEEEVKTANFEEYSFDEPVQYADIENEPVVQGIALEETKKTPNSQEDVFDDETKSEDVAPTESSIKEIEADGETEEDEVYEIIEDDKNIVETKSDEGNSSAEEVQPVEVKRGRGRPVGSVKVKHEEPQVKRGRGRPKKVETQVKEKRGRGRPIGSTKKINSPSVKNRKSVKVSQPTEKKGRGRPRKNEQIKDIATKIKAEEEKAQKAQNVANQQISQAIKGIDNSMKKEEERRRLFAEIEELKQQAMNTDEASQEEMERISARVEELLEKIDKLGE